MKRILIFLLTFSSVISYGQEIVNNFKVDNNEVIWQKVFDKSSDSSLTFDKLIEKLKYSSILTNIEESNNKLIANIKEFDALYKEAGYSEMMCPIYIARSHFIANTIIEYKEGKYRVTVKKIVLIQAYTDPLSEIGEKTNLETFALRNGNTEIRPAFKKAPSIILDYTLIKLFELKNNVEDNW